MLFQVKWTATFILSSSYCHHHFHYHHYQDAVAGQMGGNLYIITIISSLSYCHHHYHYHHYQDLNSNHAVAGQMGGYYNPYTSAGFSAAHMAAAAAAAAAQQTGQVSILPLLLFFFVVFYLFFCVHLSSKLFSFSSLLFLFQFLGIRPSMLWWRKEPQEDVKFWPKTLLITLVLSTSL